jgi:hypothetical protein
MRKLQALEKNIWKQQIYWIDNKEKITERPMLKITLMNSIELLAQV